MRVGHWIVRHGGGLTRRSNSANPAAPDAANPAPDLREVEGLYLRWGRPACFRLPSFLRPDVDQALDAAGYRREGETLTLFGSIEQLAGLPDAEVELAPIASPEWLESKANLSTFTEAQADVYRRAVRRLSLPAAFAALRREEEIVALAYGALNGRLLCLESVVTDDRHRGQGYGRRMLRALVHWAGRQGARGVCLQVQADNRPALALYRRVGLTTELYRYHYRVRPVAPAATRN